MRKICTRNFCALFVVMALVSMSSCDKKDEPGSDDPTVDNPTVSSINININTSSADVAKAELLNTSGDLAAEIATATYQNNKFVLNLPAELDASMLSNVELGINDSRVSVSNPQAKVAVMQVAAYKNDILVGYLVMTEITQNGGKEQAFMYSDRDVSITGDYSDNYDGIVFRQIYEMHLKKGWNRYYVIVNNTISPTGFTQTVRMTTSAQAGLAWEIVPNRTNLPLLTK